MAVATGAGLGARGSLIAGVRAVAGSAGAVVATDLFHTGTPRRRRRNPFSTWFLRSSWFPRCYLPCPRRCHLSRPPCRTWCWRSASRWSQYRCSQPYSWFPHRPHRCKPREDHSEPRRRVALSQSLRGKHENGVAQERRTRTAGLRSGVNRTTDARILSPKIIWPSPRMQRAIRPSPHASVAPVQQKAAGTSPYLKVVRAGTWVWGVDLPMLTQGEIAPSDHSVDLAHNARSAAPGVFRSQTEILSRPRSSVELEGRIAPQPRSKKWRCEAR